MSAQSDAKSIFLNAAEQPAGPERDAYLAAACGPDAALRQEVDELLAHHDRAGSFLQTPTLAPTIDAPPTAAAGMVIGSYKLVEPIGEGGMGQVWLAQQQEPVRRLVALKVVKAGMDTAQVLARFEAERQALALMDHPNIAQVYDAGATPSGRPFFVMELVKGTPITRYCDEHRLTPPDRLNLFVQVCRAVQHAHQKGVIHRDLKPSNVLVAPYDGKPVVKVIDFGIAKAAGQPLTEKTLVTGFGAIVGTPEYMSPEQAELNNRDIDTRSDVYSLGVLLYELLTGSTPLTRKRVQEAALMEVLRVVREEEPPKPSTRLSDSKDRLPAISAQRQTEPAKLTRLVRGELDWIVMKALEKDRSRRYESANGLAHDVENYLNDEPVAACPPSAGYRFRKFARRNKAVLAAAVAGVLVLLLGIAGLAVNNWLVAREKRNTESALEAAKAEKKRADANFARAMQAVDKFLSQIGAKRLAEVPGMEQVRREVLEEALRFFEEFLRESGDTLAVRRETASAYFHVGHIQNLLGRHDRADPAYRKAIELLGALADEFPTAPEFRRDLADSHTNLAMLLQATGRSEEAETNYRRAIGLDEELARQHPGVPAYRNNLARSYSDLGPLLKLTGRNDDAELFFRRARDLQEELVAEHPAEPAYQENLARTHLNYGLLLKMTGRPKEAEAAYRRAVELGEKLTAESPGGAGLRHELAGAHLNLGVLLEETNRSKEAEPNVRRAAALAGRLAADFPAVPDYQSLRAKTQMNLGALLRNLGQDDEADQAYRLAVEIFEKLAPAFGHVPQYHRELAGCLNNLGARAFELKQYPESEKLLRRALDVRRHLAAGPAAPPEDRGQLATALHNLAHLYETLDRGMEAEDAYREARDLFAKLAAEFPTVMQYRHVLGAVLNNLSSYPSDRGDLAEARRLLEEAIGHQSTALKSNERHPVYRLFLANHYRSLAGVFVRQGDHAKAAETAAEAPRLFPNKWQECIRAAEYLARCVPLAEKDTALLPDRRGALAKTYGDQAIARLREAVDKGCPNLPQHVKSEDFDPIRSRDDFKKLVAEMKAKTK